MYNHVAIQLIIILHYSFGLQLAPSKDKLEKNVLHNLAVIKHATALGLSPALVFVLLMDVSVQLDKS